MATTPQLEFVPLTMSLQSAWDAIVQASTDAWLFHSYDFLVNVVGKAWNYPAYHFLVKDNKRFVALCPLLLISNKHSLLRSRFLISTFGPGGPALVNGLSPAQQQIILKSIFHHIALIAQQVDADYFRFSIAPLSPAGLRKTSPLLAYRAPLPHHFLHEQTSTYLIRLNRSLPEIFASFEKRCIGAIRKAEQQGISIKKATAMHDLHTYYSMHQETYRRTGLSPHPFTYFQHIWKFIAEKNGNAVLFIAKKHDVPISSINVGHFKQACVYWTGCSRTEARSTGVNNLLQWHAIQWAKKQEYRFYEVGEAFPAATKGKEKGLDLFKKSFGGELHPYHRYTVVYKPSKMKIMRNLKKMLQLLHM